jgi:hypothetical protein
VVRPVSVSRGLPFEENRGVNCGKSGAKRTFVASKKIFQTTFTNSESCQKKSPSTDLAG